MAITRESIRLIVSELVSQGMIVTEVQGPSHSLRMLAACDETNMELVFVAEADAGGVCQLTDLEKREVQQFRGTVSHIRAQVVFVCPSPKPLQWQLL